MEDIVKTKEKVFSRRSRVEDLPTVGVTIVLGGGPGLYKMAKRTGK